MKLNNVSIKQKILMTVVIAILLSTALVGLLSQRSAKEVVQQRMLNSEMPSITKQIRDQVDHEISGLMNAAEQLANDPFLQAWLNNGRPEEQTPLVIQQLAVLKQQYDLVQTSYADKETGAYYTQSGFLRLLDKQQDSWFYDYRDSGEERMLNVFTEANGEVKLFINYQQPNGRALVGLAKSLDDMVNLLQRFTIEQSGRVFLVNAKGDVQIHYQGGQSSGQSLAQIYPNANTQSLLSPDDFNIIETQVNGVDMLVASSYIPAMDWYLVAYVPANEIFAMLDQSAYQILIWTLLIAAVFIALAAVLANSVSKPIAQVANMLQDIGAGGGDLRQRLPVNGNDEIAQLASGFNSFIEKIQQSIIEVASTSKLLNSSASDVASQAQQTLNDSELQKDRTVMVATAINEMGATVNEIASNAANAAIEAKDADNQANDGQKLSDQARGTINNLSNDVSEVGEVIESLAHHTKSIGTILDVIRAISEQTNLLALNAAIEAARAGEAGRGFAVVADEVRSLASRTAASTDEVQAMIDKLQSEAAKAVKATELSLSRSHEGVSSVDAVSESLISISERIALISDMNMQVAAATEEQSTVVEDINRNVNDINDITHRTANTAQAAAQASSELTELSHRLDSLVATFKV
ncbi:methyl-accepting chemotaxis protein [Motilimonas sp. 1_MG-2023]|uniref:methyl-accepting chemotaxis protein n=1 Tax=Motilimonas sp. 1_MG-2023 TaxID=3062672 RepID=UPI0026E403F5|nr:methyl-accepting chemotaxis protein [Motilimonas sp. 1_MG-2023]MDO6525467.1 methyl-accepting chemotaxis protein [Motilimonas sp. 1_MG-2023]